MWQREMEEEEEEEGEEEEKRERGRERSREVKRERKRTNSQTEIHTHTPIHTCADYSLFLLSRFREELQAGADVDEAVLYMLWTAGHTISVSGSTLAICFFGLMFFPGQAFRRCGPSSARVHVFACVTCVHVG